MKHDSVAATSLVKPTQFPGGNIQQAHALSQHLSRPDPDGIKKKRRKKEEEEAATTNYEDSIAPCTITTSSLAMEIEIMTQSNCHAGGLPRDVTVSRCFEPSQPQSPDNTCHYSQIYSVTVLQKVRGWNLIQSQAGMFIDCIIM